MPSLVVRLFLCACASSWFFYLYPLYDLLFLGQVSSRAHPARPGFSTFSGHNEALSTDARSRISIFAVLE